MAIRNLFLDRDGTLITEKNYLSDPAQVELLPGVAEALGGLCRAGVRLFVVTNQSGIGRGYYGEAQFEAVQERLAALLEPAGVRFTDVLHCPHTPQQECACRKPRTGMWERLQEAHGLHGAHTAMIGDNAADVAFGLSCAMAESVLVLTGHGENFAARLGLPPLNGETLRPGGLRPGWPTLLAKDLPCAVRALFGHSG